MEISILGNLIYTLKKFTEISLYIFCFLHSARKKKYLFFIAVKSKERKIYGDIWGRQVFSFNFSWQNVHKHTVYVIFQFLYFLKGNREGKYNRHFKK